MLNESMASSTHGEDSRDCNRAAGSAKSVSCDNGQHGHASPCSPWQELTTRYQQLKSSHHTCVDPARSTSTLTTLSRTPADKMSQRGYYDMTCCYDNSM